jgi:thioredoxin family protein
VCVVPSTVARRVRDSGARFAALITEPWCPDSLHAIPVLVRAQEAVPELEVRVWRRSEHPELVLSIAGEPVGGKPPEVPHVAFYAADFGELGRFRERPASVTSWLEEESRHFRTRLRLQEHQRVRAETLAGLLAAAEDRPPPAKPPMKAVYSHQPDASRFFGLAATLSDGASSLTLGLGSCAIRSQARPSRTRTSPRASSDLAVCVGIARSRAAFTGSGQAVDVNLRVTHVCRREDGV